MSRSKTRVEAQKLGVVPCPGTVRIFSVSCAAAAAAAAVVEGVARVPALEDRPLINSVRAVAISRMMMMTTTTTMMKGMQRVLQRPGRPGRLGGGASRHGAR